MNYPKCLFCQAELRMATATSTSVALDWQCQICQYYPTFVYDWPGPDEAPETMQLIKYILYFKVKDALIRWIFYQQPKEGVWSEIIQLVTRMKSSGSIVTEYNQLVKFNSTSQYSL